MPLQIQGVQCIDHLSCETASLTWSISLSALSTLDFPGSSVAATPAVGICSGDKPTYTGVRHSGDQIAAYCTLVYGLEKSQPRRGPGEQCLL